MKEDPSKMPTCQALHSAPPWPRSATGLHVTEIMLLQCLFYLELLQEMLSVRYPQSRPLMVSPWICWLRDLTEIILPGITHWNHPGFMAYFGITGSAPGILGELVSGTLNSNGMLWKTCPALTELERVVLRWYAAAVGLPVSWFGMITDTASTSTLVALAAAREATGLRIREEGLSGKPPLALYCSEEAHSSVDKAGLVLGVGLRGIRRIPSDGAFRMRVDALEGAIQEDRAEGYLSVCSGSHSRHNLSDCG